MSPTRRAVYAGVALLALVFNWGLFRLHPRLGALAAARDERAGLERQLASAPEAEALAEALAQAERELRAAGLATPAPSAEVAVEVARLAGSCGLVVVSTAPLPPAGPGPRAPAGAGLRQRLERTAPARPLVRWSAWGDFAGLLAFLDRLPRLPGAPAVVELGVERLPAGGGALAIQLLLAP